MNQPPRYVTQLDPACYSLGGRMAVHSANLGEPFMPWQRQAAQLITAVHPDDPTRWRYSLVVITVPRQAGKTTLLRAAHLDRMMKPTPDGQPPRKPLTLWTTAQTGQDARKRFNQLADLVETNGVLSQLVHRRASVGSEHLRLGLTSLAPFAPTPKALHGESTPFVSVDEAWAFDEAQAATLLAAITPTMTAFPGRQLVVISTAGDRKSRWLWSLVKAGRAAVGDPDSRTAYLEYSADPRYSDTGDGDPLSVEALDFHPAIGHTTTADDIRALYQQDQTPGRLDNIRRGFLNLWPSDMDATGAGRSLADFDTATLAGRALEQLPAPTALALDVAADRSGAAIYAAAPLPDGRTIVELVESGPGVAWIQSAPLPAAPLWHDPTGYTGAAATGLDRPKRAAKAVDLADATAGFLAAVADGTALLDGAPELRRQWEIAETRSAGIGGFAFDPGRSAEPIDHLRAAALAWHAAQTDAIPSIDF